MAGNTIKYNQARTPSALLSVSAASAVLTNVAGALFVGIVPLTAVY